ncbi:MAG: zinc ribbon domain-containing protein [Chloroflexota bacterium]|nr:MAG: hypothetical protein KatS3mg045_0696 [Bellilinea sp.]
MINDLKFCQFCGAPLEADMKVCAGCGQPVGGSGSPTEYLQSSPETPATPSTPPASFNEPATAEPPAEETPASPPPPPPAATFSPPPSGSGKNKFPTWLIVVLVLAVLCCCLTFVIGIIAFFRFANDANISEDGGIPPIVETLVPFNATEDPLFVGTQPVERLETALAPLATLIPEATLAVNPPVTEEPAMGQSLTEDTLMEDFSSNLFEWAEEADDISIHGFRDGRYFIQVLQPEYFAWSFIPTDFNPTFLRFNAQIEGNASEGTFGVMCNFKDSSNYDYVEIDLDTRSYQIGREQNDEFTPFTSSDWVDAFYLKDDPYAVNQIAVHCTTDTIRLEINGNLEADINFIPAEPDGWVALYAASWDNLSPTGFTVYFDDLMATIKE